MTVDQRNGEPLRILAISGSLRKASFNSGLLRAAQEVAPDGMEIAIFDIKPLPFYDGDLEAEGDPASVVALKSAYATLMLYCSLPQSTTGVLPER